MLPYSVRDVSWEVLSPTSCIYKRRRCVFISVSHLWLPLFSRLRTKLTHRVLKVRKHHQTMSTHWFPFLNALFPPSLLHLFCMPFLPFIWIGYFPLAWYPGIDSYFPMLHGVALCDSWLFNWVPYSVLKGQGWRAFNLRTVVQCLLSITEYNCGYTSIFVGR